jgi:integrase
MEKATKRTNVRPPAERTSSSNPSRVLKELIRTHNWRHANKPKNVSYKTMFERERFLKRFFRELAKLGCRIDPHSLGNRHIRRIVETWARQGLAASTIQTYFSFLRGFEQWICKTGMVREPAWYGLEPSQLKRTCVAGHDKTWSTNGVDVERVIAEMETSDPLVAAQLLLAVKFALRRKEAVMLCPHNAVVPAVVVPLEHQRARHFDHALYMFVGPGTKGGRNRYVAIDTPGKAAAIETAKRLVPSKDAYLARAHYSLKQNLEHFNYIMKKFGLVRRVRGVTGHGLRHEYANEAYTAQTGALSPVRGGERVAAPADTAARFAIAAHLGHSRKSIVSQYIGSPRTKASPAASGQSPTGKVDHLLRPK